MLFEPDDLTGTMQLGMWFPGEGKRERTTYEKISEYVDKVLDEATPLHEVAPGLDLVDRELAAEWINYVDPAERAKTVGPFLSKVLDGRRSVFDAAAGIGCDSVYLLATKKFQVFTNEVDELLAEQARAYADSQNASLNFMSVLWEDLPEGLRGGLRFDAVLCLGNSLCLVDDANARLQCLGAFRECLLDDGLVIIDERNFQLMLDQERRINLDPLSFATTTQPDVMYRGKRIRGYPSHVDRVSRIVNWRFVRNVPPIVERAQLDNARLSGSDLVLHAFAHGELFALLRRAGFEAIDVYADLKLVQAGAHSMPNYADIGDTGFLTYVAHKSRETRTTSLQPVEGETPVAPGA